MCHTTCAEKDAGTLVSYLTTINNWMAKNPNEVVTVLLTNGDRVSASMFGADMVTSGLAKYAYTPPSKLAIEDWPTLQQLINAGTRLVMFLGRFIPLISQISANMKKTTMRIPPKFPTSWTSLPTFSRHPTTSQLQISPPVPSIVLPETLAMVS